MNLEKTQLSPKQSSALKIKTKIIGKNQRALKNPTSFYELFCGKNMLQLPNKHIENKLLELSILTNHLEMALFPPYNEASTV